MAAESGERRAARMRQLAEEHATKAENYRRVAERIEKGNAGEHKIASLLDVLDGAGWVVLNDRYKSADSRTNIDHILVGPPGVCVIDSKNWGSQVRLDDRGIGVGKYRRDDQLSSAKLQASAVAEHAQAVVPGVITAPVLAFAGDVGLASPAYHHGVMCMQAEQLLPWLTQQPKYLSAQQVHQLGSTLDAALPPREGTAKPVTLETLNAHRAPTSRPSSTAGRSPRHPKRLRSVTNPNRGSASKSLAARALEQAARTLVTVGVLLVATVLMITVGVPMMQKGLTDAIPKIFPTPAASPHPAVAPSQKPPAPAAPGVARR